VRVEHVVMPDLPQEGVGEASEERWVERDAFVPPCSRKEPVEPDLIVKNDREAIELEAAVVRVLGNNRNMWSRPRLGIPLEVWCAVGKRVRAEVVNEEGDVLRDDKRHLLCG